MTADKSDSQASDGCTDGSSADTQVASDREDVASYTDVTAGENAPETTEEGLTSVSEKRAADPEEAAAVRPNTGKKSKRKRERDNRKGSRGQGLTPLGFALRFMAAFALVFGTYNPSEVSYYHWVASLDGSSLPSKILAGLLVLVGWVVFFRATSRSLGTIGALLAASVCGVAFWWLIDLDVVEQTTDTITYAALFIVSVVLTLGLTGSFLWRRLTGQYQVDADDGGMDD